MLSTTERDRASELCSASSASLRSLKFIAPGGIASDAAESRQLHGRRGILLRVPQTSIAWQGASRVLDHVLLEHSPRDLWVLSGNILLHVRVGA